MAFVRHPSCPLTFRVLKFREVVLFAEASKVKVGRRMCRNSDKYEIYGTHLFDMVMEMRFAIENESVYLILDKWSFVSDVLL